MHRLPHVEHFARQCPLFWPTHLASVCACLGRDNLCGCRISVVVGFCGFDQCRQQCTPHFCPLEFCHSTWKRKWHFTNLAFWMRLVSCGRAKRFIRCSASATCPPRRLLIKVFFLYFLATGWRGHSSIIWLWMLDMLGQNWLMDGCLKETKRWTCKEFKDK